MSTTTQAPIVFDDLISALKKYEGTTSYQAQDMTDAVYARDSEWGSLTWHGDKFELNEWSARQLCRLTAIPFGIFRKASEPLSQDMVKEFAPAMKDPQVKLAIKTFGANKKVLRGILSVDYPDIRNSEVLEAIKDVGEDFIVDSAGWMDQANPSTLRTRVVFPNFGRTVNNEELKLGLGVTCSELNGCDLEANVILFREVCKNGAIASYGNKPYFHFDYKSTWVLDLKDILTAAVGRAGNDLDNFMNRVEEAAATQIDIAHARYILTNAVKDGILNKGVAIKALAVLEKEGCKTAWDMVNALTAQARGFRDELRIRYERAAGLMLGLMFTRKKAEDEYAPNGPVIDLVPILPSQLALPANTTVATTSP